MAKSKKPTSTEIERMYDSGENRVTQERNDFLLPQIIDFIRQKKWLNLRPEYQRRLVWDHAKKSLFIESLLMNIPIPPIFLLETTEIEQNRYEVMDGQQRLNTILEFYENNLVLKGLETWSALNGLTYSKCPPRIRSGFDRRRIAANVLLAEGIKDPKHADFIRRTVFERLNTGGQQLNHQELRNSLYSGPFNDLLLELAGNRLFDTIWEIPAYEDHYREEGGTTHISAELSSNDLFKRMRDCEIVLRFFAFRDTANIKGSVRRILDNCMEANQAVSTQDIAAMRTSFLACLQTAHDIFGLRCFRIPNESGRWETSRPLYDAVMVSISRLLPKKARLVVAKKEINEALTAEIKKKATYEIIVGKPNTAAAVKERIAIVHDLMANHA